MIGPANGQSRIESRLRSPTLEGISRVPLCRCRCCRCCHEQLCQTFLGNRIRNKIIMLRHCRCTYDQASSDHVASGTCPWSYGPHSSTAHAGMTTVNAGLVLEAASYVASHLNRVARCTNFLDILTTWAYPAISLL